MASFPVSAVHSHISNFPVLFQPYRRLPKFSLTESQYLNHLEYKPATPGYSLKAYYIFCFLYAQNLQILYQGRQDNPLHEVAFNELIENLKERNTLWSNTMLDCERSVNRTLFMDENSDRSH